MIAFKKHSRKKNFLKNTYKSMNLDISKKYKIFKKHHKDLNKMLRKKTNLIGYGAGQMVPSLAYHLKSDLSFLKYIVDDNKAKHGQYSPGLHIPVFSTDKIYVDKPDYVLMLAWQHKDVICERHSKFIANGGKFIVPLPNICVVGQDLI